MERWRSHHVLGSRIDNEFLNRSFQNMAVRIGELLLKEKRITPEQLQEALNYQKANGAKVGFNLVKLGFVKDEEDHGAPQQAVRGAVDQPCAVRNRPASSS
jgi:hypothetical protein